MFFFTLNILLNVLFRVYQFYYFFSQSQTLAFVLVSYCCVTDYYYKLGGVRQHNSILLQFRKPEIQNQFHLAKVMVSAGLPLPLEVVEDNPLPCLFQLPELCFLPSLVCGLSIVFIAQSMASCFTCHITFCLCSQIFLCLPLLKHL